MFDSHDRLIMNKIKSRSVKGRPDVLKILIGGSLGLVRRVCCFCWGDEKTLDDISKGKGKYKKLSSSDDSDDSVVKKRKPITAPSNGHHHVQHQVANGTHSGSMHDVTASIDYGQQQPAAPSQS